MKKIAIYTFAVLATATFFSCGQSEDATQAIAVSQTAPKPIRVKLASLKPSTEALPINSSGLLASKSEAKLAFKIGGVIEDIMVEEGDLVRKGQVLAKLAQTEISAKVVQAQSAADKARRDLARAQSLFQDSVATLEQLQNAQTALEVAQAGLQIAQFNQQHAVIKAPSNGRILKRFAEIRELAGPGVPVFMLASSDNAQVMRIGVADRDIVKLQLADRARIAFDAYPGDVFAAKVTELAAAADPRTGTFEVELQLLPQAKPLKTGFVGKVQLFPKLTKPYFRLPMAALVEATGNKAYIYTPTPDGQKAQRMAVTPLHIGADFFTVDATALSGVNQVIIDGNMYLTDHAPIEIDGAEETPQVVVGTH